MFRLALLLGALPFIISLDVGPDGQTKTATETATNPSAIHRVQMIERVQTQITVFAQAQRLAHTAGLYRALISALAILGSAKIWPRAHVHLVLL
ncbi:hypothetical protein DPMN_175651 [Dreissena polymorpha]|uniref:Secreted protein n=1 Tax=Dreissena polymorpha TaxID=45954 RepID=A0A9D4IHG1_DREPO|nr:hypothetical protein DPMN_175651 [Dreissena polymorpha]